MENNNFYNLTDEDVETLRLLYLQLYGNLVEKFNNGEIDFSLSPDEDINLGNIFGVISYMYLLRGAMAIYERDLSLPVFGL